jgi:hypothetical protein
MYTAADVLLLNQIAAMEDAVIPCKLLTYMAAGRLPCRRRKREQRSRSRDPACEMRSARSGRGPQHSNARTKK